jgi:hypothetical protein
MWKELAKTGMTFWGRRKEFEESLRAAPANEKTKGKKGI